MVKEGGGPGGTDERAAQVSPLPLVAQTALRPELPVCRPWPTPTRYTMRPLETPRSLRV
jgi:hypothetical protein